MVKELAAAAVVLSALATAAVGQEAPDSVVLRGWIVDAPSRRPLPDAYVIVPGTDVGTITGAGGAFRLTVAAAPAYTVHVGRFGYLDMDFDVADDLVEESLILPLEPAPVAVEGLEVTVDRLAEIERNLDRRARAYPSSSRTIEADDIRRAGATTALEVLLSQAGGMLFGCADRAGELCARPRPRASLRGSPSWEALVRVCVDERRAWGGAAYLRSIPAEAVHRVELFGFGGRDQVRVYTRWFMIRQSRPNAGGLAPVEWGC